MQLLGLSGLVSLKKLLHARQAKKHIIKYVCQHLLSGYQGLSFQAKTLHIQWTLHTFTLFFPTLKPSLTDIIFEYIEAPKLQPDSPALCQTMTGNKILLLFFGFTKIRGKIFPSKHTLSPCITWPYFQLSIRVFAPDKLAMSGNDPDQVNQRGECTYTMTNQELMTEGRLLA